MRTEHSVRICVKGLAWKAFLPLNSVEGVLHVTLSRLVAQSVRGFSSALFNVLLRALLEREILY